MIKQKGKLMKRSLLLLTLLVMTVISVSCSPYSDFASNDYSGETLDREMLESISASIFTSEETSSVNTEFITDESTVEAGQDNVTGAVAVDTETATEADASADGSATTEDPTEPQAVGSKDDQTEPQEELYYWTAGGEVWHKSADCRYLKKSKEILSGTVSDAKDAGKERACSGCCK